MQIAVIERSELRLDNPSAKRAEHFGPDAVTSRAGRASALLNIDDNRRLTRTPRSLSDALSWQGLRDVDPVSGKHR